MKQLLVVLLFLAMSMPLFAQTTTSYNTLGPQGIGKAWGNDFSAYSIPLTDGAEIRDITGQTHPYYLVGCYGVAGNGSGYIYIDLTNPDGTIDYLPCADATSFTTNGTVTTTTVYSGRTFKCSGPAQSVTNFAGADSSGAPFSGATTLNFTYYYSPGGGGRGGGSSGCFTTLTSGTLELTR